MATLLPCPFCGEQKISLNEPSDFWPRGSINCPACMVVLPGAIGGPHREQELITEWNTRATPEDHQTLVEDAVVTLNHARVFITSRQKMHPDGVKLYDELIERLCGTPSDLGRNNTTC